MTRYHVDGEASEVTFRAHSTLHPLSATVQPSGWLEAEVVDGEFASSAITGHLELPISELRSNTPLLDREAKRHLDANRHPMVVAVIDGVTTIEGDTATITGTITVRGVDVLVEGTIALATSSPDELVLQGEGTFDMRWWALEPPRLLMMRVDPEFEVSVRLVLREA